MNKAKYKQKLQDIFPGANFDVKEETGHIKKLGDDEYEEFKYLSFKHADGYFLFKFKISENDKNRISYDVYVPDMSPSFPPFGGGLFYEDTSSVTKLRERFQKLLTAKVNRACEGGLINQKKAVALRRSLENLG